MKKALYIIVPLFALALMEGIVWLVFQSSKEKGSTPEQTTTEDTAALPKRQEQAPPDEKGAEMTPAPLASSSLPPKAMGGEDGGSFPSPTTEVVNGRTERTIHMGVRQYVWEPSVITAKKGELVRLIIHNADVLHGIAIPDLGVMEGDIPPDGAVIEFTASKVGTFEFFCSVWCGEGHMEMRGKIIIH